MLLWIVRGIFMVSTVCATIDVNLSELEYLATRLNPFECRRLIAALHYTTYELPKNVAEAERRVDDEAPCLQQLLHWNSSPSEGRGKTHEAIVHRLRQINRNDLADWLGKMTFKQLGKDLEREMDQSFKEPSIESTVDAFDRTVEPPDMAAVNDDPWADINTVFVAILLGLLGTVITLICITIVYRIKEHFRKRTDKNRQRGGAEYEERCLIASRKNRKSGFCDNRVLILKTDNDTDTDVE